jgi:hypothetical protein
MAKPKIAVIISTTRAAGFDELHLWASALMVARGASK